ncbi:MAG: hypothetical protein ACRC10_03010 [Thermoguttaceae bacterium]
MSKQSQTNQNDVESVMYDGKRYVLAEEDSYSDFVGDYDSPNLSEPEIFRKITAPPRKIAGSAAIVLLLRNGIAPLFGWFFACFGMIFCIVFIPLCMPSAQDLFTRNYKSVGKGTVTHVVDTKVTANKVPVYQFQFQWVSGDNQAKTGTCYFRGEQFKVGDEVEVEQSGDKYRIVGSTLTTLGAFGFIFAVFPLVFPVVGLSFVLTGTVHGMKTMLLLTKGALGRARFLEMTDSGVRVNNRRLMKLHYRFAASDGQVYDAYAKAVNTKKLTDDPVELLLYDETNPKRSVLLDSLPGKIKFDESSGEFRTNPIYAVLPLLFFNLFQIELIVCIYAIATGGILPFIE